jgi:hypothetical protein
MRRIVRAILGVEVAADGGVLATKTLHSSRILELIAL